METSWRTLLADRRRECSYDTMFRALELYWRPRRARAGSEYADVLGAVPGRHIRALGTKFSSQIIIGRPLIFPHKITD